jgi:hypothetical protein
VLVNAITKSATNLMSGSAYGYFRNDKFNAADFVAGRVLPYSNQQVGGTIGGPIVRDRAHFFWYYELEREPTTCVFNGPLSRGSTFPTCRSRGRSTRPGSASTRS